MTSVDVQYNYLYICVYRITYVYTQVHMKMNMIYINTKTMYVYVFSIYTQKIFASFAPLSVPYSGQRAPGRRLRALRRPLEGARADGKVAGHAVLVLQGPM